eukprot:7525290-Karenia_brevis.AAC.1
MAPPSDASMVARTGIAHADRDLAAGLEVLDIGGTVGMAVDVTTAVPQTGPGGDVRVHATGVADAGGVPNPGRRRRRQRAGQGDVAAPLQDTGWL